ncbi:MAG: hypothetical protein RQ899_01890 [Pseudomonadales bacterium]|nr:hypothetical protein [Pseudomonadales bacterium]
MQTASTFRARQDGNPDSSPARQAGTLPLLSISIVTHQVEPQDFAAALASLATAIDGLVETREAQAFPEISLGIVDNGGQRELLQGILEQGEKTGSIPVPARLVCGQGNIGYGRAHNLLIDDSHARYHLILNPDVLLDAEALVRGIRYLEANPAVVAVAPAATDAQQQPHYLCKRYPSVLTLLLRGFAGAWLQKCFHKRLDAYVMKDLLDAHRAHSADADALLDVPLLSGCFMLCRTAALHAVGGFDAKYFLYFEDFALSLTLRRHGELAWLPGMKIQHFGGNSAGKGLRHILYFMHSGIRFFNSHGWKWL